MGGTKTIRVDRDLYDFIYQRAERLGVSLGEVLRHLVARSNSDGGLEAKVRTLEREREALQARVRELEEQLRLAEEELRSLHDAREALEGAAEEAARLGREVERLRSLEGKARLCDRLLGQLAAGFGVDRGPLIASARDGSLAEGCRMLLDGFVAWHRLLRAFPCARCGKPIEWTSPEALIRALRDAIKAGKWAWYHKRCA